MNIVAYNSSNVFSELKTEWNDLLQRSVTNRIFNTWEWQTTWWEAYHPGELWVITVRNVAGKLIAIAPWFIDKTPNNERIVRTIGCVDVTDYLDLLVDAGCYDEALTALTDFVAAHSDKYEMINLCNLPQNSAGFRYFAATLEAHSFQVTLTQQEVCPIINLPTEWEAYFELLDKKQRHELRRKLRRVEAATENMTWYSVDQSHDLTTEIEKFLHLMSASQVDKAEFLSDDKNIAFFKAITPIALANNWLHMNFLTINGVAVAAYMNFIYGNQVLVYNSGLLPNEYGQLSPGIILLIYNIQWAIDQHFSVFDFLRGSEEYKYRMGAMDTPVYMLQAKLKKPS
jgi:CelD/BcsL family acetyltransferase involved in cellulose biosynthesis